jgi:transposase, IS30 family
MKKTNKLTSGERDRIALWYSRKLGVREIARKIRRSPTTISREVKRNRHGNHYVSIHAHKKAKTRKMEAGRRSPLKDPLIYSYVIEKLRSGWSPEQIAGRLLKDHKDKSIHWETIYRFIYSDKAKNKKLFEYLPRKHKKRRFKFGRKASRSRIPDTVSIHDRPRGVEDRQVFGHWEGDSVVGKYHKSGIHTQVERKTRFLKAKLIQDFSANETLEAQNKIFSQLPTKAKKSTTVDNGNEFTNHKKFDLPVFFCDPYSSWQKATNENTNGLIRRYLPKKTDFRRITQQDLDDIVDEINNRPRKCLNYQTPQETFTNELSVAIGMRM